MKKQLEVKELNISHLADVLKLQDKIIEHLHPDEKHFILKRSVEDFMKALDSDHTHMIGVFDGDKLVAQSIFEFPQNGAAREYTEFAEDVANEDLVVYKATLVDVDYRGQGLMQRLLQYREQKAKAAGKTTAISQIAVDNPASWINALKNGMSIRKVDYDPDDGAKVLYMRKDFNGKAVVTGANVLSMYLGQDIHKEIPALFNKMRYWAERGYRGGGIDQQSNSLMWVKSSGGEPVLALDAASSDLPLCLANAQGKTTRS